MELSDEICIEPWLSNQYQRGLSAVKVFVVARSVPGAVATGLSQDGETRSLPLPVLT